MAGFHVRALLVAVLAGAVTGLATSTGPGHIEAGWVALAVLGVFALFAGVGLLRRSSTTYTVTDRRLIIEYGLLSRDVQEAGLERVQNVACRQSIRQRLLGTGSVHFDTAAGAGYDFCFRGVARPREMVRMVDGAIQRAPRARVWV